MKRLFFAGLLAVAAAGAASGQASAATLTVCPSGCAFSQIAPAVAAANNGDTISIAPGTYAGGFTITKSVTLAGAGADKTIISGGGPVITIGTFGASSEPTVSISGVTITGGVTRSSPESVPCTGKAGVWAAGGGIQVPPHTFFFGGAGVC
jgi:nitrous oxidase accessory protein NosD